MTPWPQLKRGLTTPGLGSDMVFKIVVLFLVFMGVMAMFGKMRYPGQKALEKAKCKKCGRYRIGKGECPCTKHKKKS